MLKIDLKYAEDHQEQVVECLECSDDTLKLKTLDLLYTMTNKDNVEAIIEKMLEHLKHAPADSRVRRDLVKKIYQSVEKYSPNKKWFVKTMNKLFEMGADLITLDISNKFINVICEHEAETDSKSFRDSIIKIYKNLLKKTNHIPDSHMQVIVYILGEYVPRMEKTDKAEDILNLLCDACDRKFEKTNTFGWIVSAITKIHTGLGFTANEKVDAVINKYFRSTETHLQQRCKEYKEIKQIYQGGFTDIKDSLFTSHSELKNTEYDYELSFLDDYVQEAINQGASTMDDEKREIAISITGTQDIVTEKELNFRPYEKPTRGAVNIRSQPIAQPRQEDETPGEVKLVVKNNSKKGRWTKQGYMGKEEEKKVETKPKTFQKQTEEVNPDSSMNTPPYKQKEQEPEKQPKKNKLAGALFAGVVKKDNDSDDSDSSSSSSEEDSDEVEKKKKKKKKAKAKTHDVEELVPNEPQEKKADFDELFDLGDSQDIDPYKGLPNQQENNDNLLLDTNNSQPQMQQQPGSQPNSGGMPFNQMNQMPNQYNTYQQNYGYSNQQQQQPQYQQQQQNQQQQQQPNHDDPFADLFGAFSNQPNSGS